MWRRDRPVVARTSTAPASEVFVSRVSRAVWLCVCVAVLLRLATPAVAAEGTVVSGTVSGSDQGFLKGALVVLDGSGHRETRTDADGRFTFVDVPRGQYRFAASADGYLPIEQSMQVGTASISVDIVLLHLPGLP